MRDVLQTAPARHYGSNRPRRYGRLVVDPVSGDVLADWPRALPAHRSPCRSDSSKGLAQHRCSDAHAAVVEGYRRWRDDVLAEAERHTHGYAGDEREYWMTHTRPTFRDYLTMSRDETRDQD